MNGQEDRRTLAGYNAWDCYATALLARRFPEVLKRNGQWAYWHREFMPLVPAVLAMQRRGIGIDIRERARLKREFTDELAAGDLMLTIASGCDTFNPNSDTQLRRWLFGGDRTRSEPTTPITVAKPKRKADPVPTVACLGLKPAGKTDGGTWSVDRDNLMRVLRDLRQMDTLHRPILHTLLHRSRINKLLEYLDFAAKEVEGGHRIYPLVKMTGAKTLRYAYSNPPIHSWADEIRSMVVASPGNLLAAADYSAIESRIFAWLTGDKVDMERFAKFDAATSKEEQEEWDIHSNTAKELFGLTDLPPEKRKAYRNAAKTVRYGVFQYGGQPETVHTKTYCPCPKCADKMPDSLSLTPADLKRITERWFLRHPNVLEWRSNSLKNFSGPHASRSITLPSGLPTFFFKPWGGDLQREVWNRPLQHTAAWIIGRAQRRLHEIGAPIILNHHDQLMVECPEKDAEWWVGQMKKCMEVPVSELGGMRFPVEAMVGPNWNDMRKA